MAEQSPSSNAERLPFHSFTFTCIQGRNPRAFMSIVSDGEGMYDLHVEKGSASRPVHQFTRKVPRATAEKLADGLRDAGMFGWDERYEGSSDVRWNSRIVFQEGVFDLSSKGVGGKPSSFDRVLDLLYGLDFPRPNESKNASASSTAHVGSMFGQMGMGIGGLSAGDLGAYGAVGKLPNALEGTGIDLSQLSEAFEDVDAADMARLMSEFSANPQMLQQRMREQFRSMPPAEQEHLIDALTATGMASRAYWERFFRG